MKLTRYFKDSSPKLIINTFWIFGKANQEYKKLPSTLLMSDNYYWVHFMGPIFIRWGKKTK